MDLNFDPIKLTELIRFNNWGYKLLRVRELGLVSPKFICILDPPATTTKLPNLTKKLSMLTATRRRSSRSLNFIWSSWNSQQRRSSWRIRVPESQWRRAEEVHKALILLWRTFLSTATSCSWSSHHDLPLCRQRPPSVINSLISSKASTATSCVDGDLPLVSSLPPRVHVFCPGSYQWSLFLLIGWVPQAWEGYSCKLLAVASSSEP